MKIFGGKILPVWIGLGAALISLLIYKAGIFAGFEYFLGDQLLDPIGASSEIVIVAIDDESIGKIGQWPWPREEYAKLLNTLDKNSPKVVGIDVVFSEASRIGKRDDEKLAVALAKTDYPIVLAKEGDKLLPLSIFDEDGSRGADVHLIVDPDGVVRRVNFENTFAIHVGQAVAPPRGGTTADNTNARIAFAGPPGTFRRVPFSRVVEDTELATSLKDKIVLVGATATDLHDEQVTAIARGTAMPGVEIQANLVNMLNKNVFVNEGSLILNILIIILAALLPAFAFVFLAGMFRPVLVSVVAFVVMIIALIIIWSGNVALPIFYPSLAWFLSTAGQVLHRYFGAEKSRREIKSLFGKYVSRDVLEELLRNPSAVKLGGEERDVTVLFSDIRGFTTLSESMTPIELTTFMNRYLTVMTDVILTHKGVVDKYIGDAIMAFWGAPLPSETHGEDAVSATVAMSEALDNFNSENKSMGLPVIEIGIGLNSGKVVAGNMGSEQRFDYTIMGDTVNLASRLESLTKAYGVRIIASDTLHLSDATISREIDRVKVKGKNMAVKILEVIPYERKEDFENVNKRFDLARDYYYKGDWDKCLKLLAEIEKIMPDDGPTKVLRERCLQFKVVPPAIWDGVYEHKSK